jgi:small subunit ribosomal protein S5
MAPRMREQKNMETPEFEQRLVEVARVTRVMAGGKRMRFRALLVIGDRKGRVGMGIAKASDVTIAIQKAFNHAKKNIINVPLHKGTIPHFVLAKHTASKIILKPAKPGAGIKAGGAVRIVLELAGVQDVTAKILGGNNKVNGVKATLDALSSFTLTPDQRSKMAVRIQKQEVEREAQAKARAKMKAQGGFKRGGKPFGRRDDRKSAPQQTSTQA